MNSNDTIYFRVQILVFWRKFDPYQKYRNILPSGKTAINQPIPGQKQYFATVNIDQYQTEIKNLKEQNSNLVNEIQNLKNTIAQQNLFSSNVK